MSAAPTTERKIALITGATDGIGKATARRLLRDGWEVVVTGRSRSKCDATVVELAGAVPGARVSALVADLGVMDEVRRAASEFLASHERLDLLLLNANSITQQHTARATASRRTSPSAISAGSS